MASLHRGSGFVFIFLCAVVTVHGQYAAKTFQTRPQSRFLENKGQVLNENGGPATDVKYTFSAPGFKLAMLGNSLTYEVYHATACEPQEMSEATGQARDQDPKKPRPYGVQSQQVTVLFPGCSQDVETIAEGSSDEYMNYYPTNGGSKGTTFVHSYDKITYRNLYKGIDLVFYAPAANTVAIALKYDIVVHPEGRLGDLKMCYQGAGSLHAEGGKLVLDTRLGKLSEEIPKSYLQETELPAQVAYQVNNNTVSFSTASSINHQTLVIDPYLVWGTYLGGSTTDYVNDVAAGTDGIVYVTGYTASTSNIATTGAHQTSLAGGYDGFVAAFDSNGVRKWATYYGGTASDYGRAIAIDPGGNILMVGQTTSDSNKITTPGAFQNRHASEAAMLVKFNKQGIRKWGTFYGSQIYSGTSMQGLDVATDSKGAVYITGWTDADDVSAIITSGSYQSTFTGGKYPDYADGFLAKFDSLGKRVWGTYYGGGDNDYATSLAVDKSDNIYIAGYTLSTNKIATSGSYNSSLTGGRDVFLAKFSPAGARLWGTYYGGSSDDYLNAIALDGANNVYLTGYTTSTSGIATTGAHLTAHTGGNDAFLTKFDSLGNLAWGTYYGGTSDDDGDGLTTDKAGNVYLSGSTLSSSGIATPGTFQTTTAGSRDAFISLFNTNGKQLAATYYGGPGLEYGYAIAVDKALNIYLAGRTSSDQWIATSKGYQQKRGGSSDGFIAKFKTTGALDAKMQRMVSPENEICPATRMVSIRYKNNGNTQIDSVRIQWSINGTVQPAQTVVNKMLFEDTSSIVNLGNVDFKTGTYNLKFWTLKPNGLQDDSAYNDTLKTKVIVHAMPVPSFLRLDSCEHSPTHFINNSTIASGIISKYLWRFRDGTTDTAKTPVHVYQNTGTYSITLVATSDFGCADSFLRTVTVHPRAVVSFVSDSVCTAVKILFANNSSVSKGTLTYSWSFGDGNTSAAISPSYAYSAPGIYAVKLWAKTNMGCLDSFQSQAQVYQLPNPGFKAHDTCSTVSVSFINKSSLASGKIISYLWTFGDGDTSLAIQPSSHHYAKAGKYKVTLMATTDKGCRSAYADTVAEWAMPVAGFMPGIACATADMPFTNKSNIATGTINKWKWYFGDGGQSTIEAPSHNYAKPGKYPITLNVSSDRGCADTHTDTAVVHDTLMARFSYKNVCLGNDVYFTDLSTAGKENMVAHLWKFGDGDSSRVDSPGHAYIQAGRYGVVLAVANDVGCESHTSDTVTIYDVPVADFGYSEACEYEPVLFSDKSTIASGSIENFAWDFGDGIKDTVQKPSHVYPGSGKYIVTLTTQSHDNCNASISKTVDIHPLPKSGFGVTIIGLSATSSAKDTTSSSYSWDWGDGQNSAGAKATHIYSKPGTYKLKLTVVNQYGCSTDSTVSLTVTSTGIEERQTGYTWKLYPNPACDHYFIIEGFETRTAGEVQLWDMQGKCALKTAATLWKSTKIELPEAIEPGAYIVKVKYAGHEDDCNMVVK